MEFAKAQRFTARVSEKYFLTDNEHFLYLKFELVLPDRMIFEAGQYVSFAVNALGERRSYSMATTPDDNHGFTLVAGMTKGGKGSIYLHDLKIGEEVEVLAPLGRFVAESTQNKLLFVATGSGIVPIYSMICDLLINKQETRPMRLHWGLKNEANMFWFDNFERLAEAHPNFVFDPVLSEPGEEWSLCRGHVQDCLQRDFTKDRLAEWSGYVCGNPKMVDEVSALLIALGMQPEEVYREKYT